jgi:hypothetical protein
MKHPARVLALCAGAMLLAATSGCASPDCTDTATCAAASDEGGTGGDSDASAGPDAACDPENNACSDPQCAPSFICVPEAPSGWVGPIALFDQGGGPPPPTPDACAGAYPDDLFDGLANPSYSPLQCTCSCSGPVGGPESLCTAPSLGVYWDANCENLCSSLQLPTPCTSAAAGCASGGGSANVVLPAPIGTWSCSPQATAPTSSYSWTRAGRGCGVTRDLVAGGCGANAVCADKPPTGFQPTLCIYANQNYADCSSVPGYPVFHQYFTSANDGRSCEVGTCGCDAPTDAACQLQGSAAWFPSGQPSCMDGGTPIQPTGVCATSGGAPVVTVESAMTVTTTGTCNPTGTATPQGTVTPDTTTAITVCCAQ